jgi:hypothetical protein
MVCSVPGGTRKEMVGAIVLRSALDAGMPQRPGTSFAAVWTDEVRDLVEKMMAAELHFSPAV